jgi:hypothetical protein
MTDHDLGDGSTSLEEALTDSVAMEVVAHDGQADCPKQAAGPKAAGGARSAGFSGTDQAYYNLYMASCSANSDCANACVAAGGTTESCTAASLCPPMVDGPSDCLPPPYWTNVSGALSQTTMANLGAELILVSVSYYDPILVNAFHLSIPDGAIILGIQFTVSREADDGFAVDGAVRVLKNGAPVGVDHSRTDSWPRTLTEATYGSETDTWGATWTPSDVRADGFGISVDPKYTGPSNGNDRAHLSSIKALVYYIESTCD